MHQPQYLPWIPYFKKILLSDVFVFLDYVQYQKNGIINRNQLKNSNGKFWLTVPVLNPMKKKISEVEIDNNSNWKKKHLSSIKNNYLKSSNYNFFTKYINPIFNKNNKNISDFNIELIKIIVDKFFKKDIKFVRQKNIQTKKKSTDLIIEICKELQATHYISGLGGKNYLDLNKFSNNDIGIEFVENTLPNKYNQQYQKIGFIPDISALDFILNVDTNYTTYINI